MRAPAGAVALIAAVGGGLLVPAVPLADETPAPPTATLEAPATSVEAGKALKLDSSKSTAGATPIVGHVWDLDGDGSFETDTGPDPSAEVTPEAPGPLTVQVRVVDEGGQNADAKLDLTVTAPPAPEGIDQPEADSAGRVAENGSDEGAGDGGGTADSGGGRPAEPPAASDPPAPPAAAPAPASEPHPAQPEQPSPAGPAQPEQPAPAEPAQPTLSPVRMSAAPALVPRRALAVRAAAQGETRPVAEVHAAASSGVTIKDFKYAPPSISVSVGDTITWTNQDVAPHTATANDGSFDTGSLSKGKSGSHTFTKAGSFPYICSIHPSMKGTVTVAAASGGGDTGSGAAATPDTSSADTGGGLPQTGLDLIAVVLLASLMMGSGAVLRRRVG